MNAPAPQGRGEQREERTPQSGRLQKGEWTAMVVVGYALALEQAVGVLIFLQTGQSGFFQWMVAPLPFELAAIGPIVGLIAWRRRPLVEPVLLACATAVVLVNTVVWLAAVFAWFFLGCGGGLFCHGGPLGQ